jgi:hypothetical protein
MAGSKNTARRRTIISARPSAAEAVADAFVEARLSAEAVHAALQKISADLDREWEGDRKKVFLEDLQSVSDAVFNRLLPLLRTMENKYRAYASMTPEEKPAPD